MEVPHQGVEDSHLLACEAREVGRSLRPAHLLQVILLLGAASGGEAKFLRTEHTSARMSDSGTETDRHR